MLPVTRTRDLMCPVEGCTGRFAEQKEVNRHVRNTHPAFVRPNVQVVEGAPSSGARSERMGNGGAGRRVELRRSPITNVISISKKSTESTALSCPIPTCSRVFKTPGWLARHIKSKPCSTSRSSELRLECLYSSTGWSC